MLIPKDWSKFQHYKKRRPPWVKLHREYLDDHVFQGLPDASRALAPMLWLLASERLDGHILLDIKALAFRLHLASDVLEAALKPLISAGYFSDPTGMLADCKHDASKMLAPETETETETETEIYRPTASKGSQSRRPKPSASDPDFDLWYQSYPRREGRGAAEKAYQSAKKLTDTETLLAGAKRAAQKYTDPKFTPMPATWLNQKRWLDEAPGLPPPPTPRFRTGADYV